MAGETYSGGTDYDTQQVTTGSFDFTSVTIASAPGTTIERLDFSGDNATVTVKAH